MKFMMKNFKYLANTIKGNHVCIIIIMLLKICIDKDSHSYDDFSLYQADVLEKFDFKNDEFLSSSFLPHKYYLFNQDIFHYDAKNKTIELYSSSTRDSEQLPGILKLNKTYGKHNNKMLYKCIPDDKRLPMFLVAYNIPPNFNKTKDSLYILFAFLNWTKQHPYGIVKQNLGTINELPNFYEYVLYCKSLQISNAKFIRETYKAVNTMDGDTISDKIMNMNSSIEDRTKGYYIFSIDGDTTTDFDDAISFQNNVLSIYISNVSLLLDALNLWEAFSKRVSTIYLPNHKRNMLPNILSDDLCSLTKNTKKIALTMDITLMMDENENVVDFKSIQFKNTMIKVRENFVYDSPKLMKNKHYKKIFDLTNEMNKNILYIHNIRNSCDVISYLMILMNYQTSLMLKKYEIGIFRKLDHQYDESQYKNVKIKEEDKQFLFFYRSNCAQYCTHDDSTYNTFMYESIKQYTHITSPIRRLVDLLNSIILQKELNLWDFDQGENKSNCAITFYTMWLNNLDYINLMMRSIRKVQNNCNILNKIEQHNTKYNIPLICKGLCFDTMERNNKMKMFNVYIRELGYVGKYSISEDMIEKNSIQDLHYYNFEIYLFMNEENLKKKVKIKYIGPL